MHYNMLKFNSKSKQFSHKSHSACDYNMLKFNSKSKQYWNQLWRKWDYNILKFDYKPNLGLLIMPKFLTKYIEVQTLILFIKTSFLLKNLFCFKFNYNNMRFICLNKWFTVSDFCYLFPYLA